MTDEEGLLKVIVADPDDDTVRLAYADWLDENRCAGHAEFIQSGWIVETGCATKSA
jgi:uncharacterized protein (TIGR02996 family)